MAPKAIPEGYELLTGRGRENALKALKIAEERGLPAESVRTSTMLGGFLIPLGDTAAATEETETEIVFPDPEKATHAEIDNYAANFDPDLGGAITYDGIEAENAEKPTKAEKVAHIQKVVGERAAANDQTNTDGADGADKGE